MEMRYYNSINCCLALADGLFYFGRGAKPRELKECRIGSVARRYYMMQCMYLFSHPQLAWVALAQKSKTNSNNDRRLSVVVRLNLLCFGFVATTIALAFQGHMNGERERREAKKTFFTKARFSTAQLKKRGKGGKAPNLIRGNQYTDRLWRLTKVASIFRRTTDDDAKTRSSNNRDPLHLSLLERERGGLTQQQEKR